MLQQNLADSGFEKYRKKTRKEASGGDGSDYPLARAGSGDRALLSETGGCGATPQGGGERMLRIHFLQDGFELSDPAVEEAPYDSRAMSQFVGIGLGQELVPDETTICKFRI